MISRGAVVPEVKEKVKAREDDLALFIATLNISPPLPPSTSNTSSTATPSRTQHSIQGPPVTPKSTRATQGPISSSPRKIIRPPVSSTPVVVPDSDDETEPAEVIPKGKAGKQRAADKPARSTDIAATVQPKRKDEADSSRKRATEEPGSAHLAQRRKSLHVLASVGFHSYCVKQSRQGSTAPPSCMSTFATLKVTSPSQA